MMSKAISKPYTQPDTRLATLKVLGGLDLRDTDGQPIELKARKSRQLLAYLAIPSGQVRSREQLASLLWSDRQDEQARGSLRTALSGIRRAVGDDALVVEHDTVRLREGYLDTDYYQLKNLIDNNGSISKLGDFYTGEFLADQEHDGDLYMEWLRGLRIECADMALSVLERNSERLAESGDNKSAIGLMRESLSLEPLKEQTHRAIMKLYAASGERAMALAQFRTCKEVLLHELDAVPDPETQALADKIALKDSRALKVFRDQSVIALETVSNITTPDKFADTRLLTVDDEVPSIAVLPFVNMSGDAEQNYFADGMTEDIITDLSDVDGLSVAAKGSSQMYRGAPVSPAQISQEIGARYILEGSVRKAGESVRISAQLTDAHSNLQTWAQRYDRRLENIFELQSEISKAIVAALELNLTTVAGVSERRTTASVEAYQCYLRGQRNLHDVSKSSIILSHELFGQAIELDPEYALAYAGLAQSAIYMVLHYDVDRAMIDEALENCNFALRLQPELAEAYSARGNVRIFLKEFENARLDIEKAISIAPNLAVAHFHMGQYHVNTAGGILEGYNSYKRAFDLGNDLRSGMMANTCLHGLNRPEELELLSKKILKIAQRKFFLNPHDFDAIQMTAFAYNDLGEIEEAKKWAGIASSFDTEDGGRAYNLACLHSVMGSVDEALVMLEKTLSIGCNEMKVRFMKYTDPDLELVREDPRFDKLLVRYGYNLPARKLPRVKPKS